MDESYRNRNEDFNETTTHDEGERRALYQQGAQPSTEIEEDLYPDSRSNRDTEIAQELTMDEPMKSEEHGTEMKSDVETGFGWLAVVLAALSFFVMPLILGAAGIIFGFISKNRGADTLGNIAIFAGAVAVVLSLFL